MLGLFRKKTQPVTDPRERRRLFRIPEDNAMFVIEDVSYALMDWSIDGFRARGYEGGRFVGQELRARLILVHKGMPAGFDMRVKILRENPGSGELAGQIVSMAKSARKDFARVYRERLAAHQARYGTGAAVDA